MFFLTPALTSPFLILDLNRVQNSAQCGKMGAVRLFVAIPIPEEVQDDLGGLTGSLAGVKWTDPQNIHLTLHFLGEDFEPEEIHSALASVHSGPFPVEVKGVGRFLHNQGGAIWAGVLPSPQLMELHARIGKALRAVSVPTEKRAYQPHITLGRVKNEPEHRIQDYILHHQDFHTSFKAVSFALFSSRLRPEGPIHSIDMEYEFD